MSEPDDPERRDGSPRRSGRRRAALIGARLKRLRKKPVNASAMSSSESRHSPRPQRRRSAEAAEDRARDRDLRLAPGVVRQLLQHDHGAEERDEQRRRHAAAPAASPRARGPSSWTSSSSTKPIANFQPQSSAYARDRDEHRAGDREDLELEDRDEDELELPEQDADGGDRRPELAAAMSPQGQRVLIGE